MRKKSGFTLIELIAVLVILSIIALIVTPLVLNVINKAKTSANKRSVDAYGRSVEIAISKYLLNTNDFPTNFEVLDVEYSGENVACEVKELNSDGTIYLSKCKVGKSYVYDKTTDDGYYHYGKKRSSTLPPEDVTEKFENGSIIYYNPETNQKCNQSEAVSLTGTKNGCMKWYAINDEEGKTEINLLLDHNTTALTVWDNSNQSSMQNIINQLNTDTKTWNSEINARLISANEIAQITNYSEFDENVKDAGYWFYFDTNNQNKITNINNKSKYAYLFDNTNSCLENGCNIEDNNYYLYDGQNKNVILGYWTSSLVYNASGKVWHVSKYGALNNDYIIDNYDYGIRPVISVKKYIIK